MEESIQFDFLDEARERRVGFGFGIILKSNAVCPGSFPPPIYIIALLCLIGFGRGGGGFRNTRAAHSHTAFPRVPAAAAAAAGRPAPQSAAHSYPSPGSCSVTSLPTLSIRS